MLNWSSRFDIFCLLDNNNYNFDNSSFECLLAAGCERSVVLPTDNLFKDLKDFCIEHPGWLFGHFNYPAFKSPASDRENIDFPAGFFFKPSIVLQLKQQVISIESVHEDPDIIFASLQEQASVVTKKIATKSTIHKRYTREEYDDIITSLKKHILRGDCYEINFCQDFYSTDAVADPLFLFAALNELSPAPFATFYKLNDKYCIGASPERFLKKNGSMLVSQPIKGTAKRDHTNELTDFENKRHLENSLKERSENVMIVDLVRNDMSKICLEGTVNVRELFGIYSFPQVYQMMSTIEGKVAEHIHWVDLIDACFPMGSMTGAPKKKVMELIEKYESVSRELFSGSIGYVDPEGNVDFNVVIRTLFYNETRKIISFKAGGGITFNSNAVDEYEESMLKASAMMKVLEM